MKRMLVLGVQLPVLVSDLDLECKMWIKLRLAPMCPYIGSISLAFVGAPNVKVQLLPYNRVRVMRIPILQVFTACFCEIVNCNQGHGLMHISCRTIAIPG
jgi:Ca2+-dependent lipid-binding protein